MKLNDIIPLREDQLESFYIGLSEDQKKSFILIEDALDDMLLISYSQNNTQETIRPMLLRLYATTWDKDAVAVRIDSHRFLSAEEELGDSEDILEVRTLCKKIQQKLTGHPEQDRIDQYLQDIIFIIQNKEGDISSLFDLNNELDAHIIDLLGEQSTPYDEPYPEQDHELNIDNDLISEPIQEESIDKSAHKISTKVSPHRKARAQQQQP
jgi:hypothetical protein